MAEKNGLKEEIGLYKLDSLKAARETQKTHWGLTKGFYILT